MKINRSILYGLTVFFITIEMSGQGKTRIINLKGEWDFSIRYIDNWNELNANNGHWEKIKVPSPWESQGFYGYDGYAFYRKKVNISSLYKNDIFFLQLGYIDDVDEVYFNGVNIGSSGSFPPKYTSAFNAKREYTIPNNLIRFDENNIIAVKVYDSQREGGIVSGNVGIYILNNPITLDINLQGTWKFKTGDQPEYAGRNYDDRSWDEVIVPSYWENMGYRDYNGYAWYRITFNINKNLPSERLVLVLGVIDDVDEAYLNGQFIGKTGYMHENKSHAETWKDLRGYYFTRDLLNMNGQNTIAVKVKDFGGGGGIHKGPVGIVTQEKYIEFWRRKKNENM